MPCFIYRFQMNKNPAKVQTIVEVNTMSKNYRKSRLLVPEAYDAMTRFKLEIAEEMGLSAFCKENNDHYKGDLSARQNGSEGGPIGGEMVRRMIQDYENKL